MTPAAFLALWRSDRAALPAELAALRAEATAVIMDHAAPGTHVRNLLRALTRKLMDDRPDTDPTPDAPPPADPSPAERTAPIVADLDAVAARLTAGTDAPSDGALLMGLAPRIEALVEDLDDAAYEALANRRTELLAAWQELREAAG